MPAPESPGGALVPVPKFVKPDRSTRGGVPIGVLLEKARKRVGYSQEAVCRALWLSDIDLDHYESGVRTPPPAVVEQLAEYYGIDPARFSPDAKAERVQARNGAEHDTLWLGWASVDLSESDGSTEFLLRGIAQTMRAMRSASETAPVTIRDEELAAIGAVLDLDDTTLHPQLMVWFALDDQPARDLIARLRHAVAVTKQLPEVTGEANRA